MLGGVLGFAGLIALSWRLWRTRPAFDPRPALLIGFGVPFWLVWWWLFSYDLRFLLLAWPLFAVMGGAFSMHVLDVLAARIPPQRQRIAAWALAALLVIGALPALRNTVDHKPELLRDPFMDDAARHTIQLGGRWDVIGWVRANVPVDAPILVEDYRFVYYLMQDHARVDFAVFDAEAADPRLRRLDRPAGHRAAGLGGRSDARLRVRRLPRLLAGVEARESGRSGRDWL